MTTEELGYDSFGIRTAVDTERNSPLEARNVTFPGAINAGSVYIGRGDNIFKADGEGIYLGGSSFDDAPFSVDMGGNAILTSATITGMATEIWLGPIIPQWTDSWTLNNTYTDVGGSIFDINFDDLDGWYVYFSMVGKTDAGTGYWRLYNDDDSAEITDSEISTTSTTPVDLRSGALTLPSGTKTVKVQHKIVDGDGATEYVNSVMAKIVVRSSL